MRIARALWRVPLIVPIVLAVATAIAALLATWTSPAGAEDFQTPKRDYSDTIKAEDSGKRAAASIVPTNDAVSIAGAITRDTSFVTGASFSTIPPFGQPNAVSDSELTGFPINGSTYGILTTGDAALAEAPNDAENSGADDGGGNVRGDTDFDVSVLKIDLSVPSGANCLSFDFRFLSEEYPEFVGTDFNDAFIAELDSSTWTTSGSTISAPSNFAFDENGNVISINSTGSFSVSPDNAVDTTYDAGTGFLQAKTPVTPGAHSLYLSIFDQGDNIYDSAAFIDNLNLYSVSSSEDCEQGVSDPTPLKVNDVEPDNGARKVPRTTPVTVTFSEPVKTETLTSSTFMLAKGSKQVLTTVTPSSDGKQATLTPSARLGKKKTYTVTVQGGSNGVKSTDGSTLDQNFVSFFKTGKK